MVGIKTAPIGQVITGQQFYANADKSFSRKTGLIWHRYDKVKLGDKTLEGHVRVQEFRLIILGRDLKQTRTETTTHFRDQCVLGCNLAWLIRMNEEHNTRSE